MIASPKRPWIAANKVGAPCATCHVTKKLPRAQAFPSPVSISTKFELHDRRAARIHTRKEKA